MISPRLPTIYELEGNFEKFADYLFSHENPPAKNTLFVDIEYDDNQNYNDFLYDLFSYGYYKKFGPLSLKNASIEHFNIIRDYIRAIGTDVVLLDYTYNEIDEIKSINIKFVQF